MKNFVILIIIILSSFLGCNGNNLQLNHFSPKSEQIIDDQDNRIASKNGSQDNPEITKEEEPIIIALKPPTNKPNSDNFHDEIEDIYGNTYQGKIDISLWSEIQGKMFIVNNNKYPITNIESLCFGIVNGKGIMVIHTKDNYLQKETINLSFFQQLVKFKGSTLSKHYQVQEIQCLYFNKPV